MVFVNEVGLPKTCSEHHTSDDKGATWTQLADAPWVPRHCFHSGLKSSDGKIYIWGQDDTKDPETEAFVWPNDIWRYDAVNGWVQSVSDAGLGQLMATYGCMHKDYLYVCNGSYAGIGNGVTRNNKIYRSDGESAFEEVADLPETMQNLESGCLVSFKGKLVHFSGGLWEGNFPDPKPEYNNQIHVSEDDGLTWELVGTDNRLKSYWTAGAATQERIYMIRGINNGGAEEIGILYTEDMINWHEFEYNVQPRHAASMCVHDGMDVIFGVGDANDGDDVYLIKKIASRFKYYG